MANKIDDLFSPERLRSSWDQIKERGVELAGVDAAELEDQNALQVFEHLERVIHKRFQGEDAEALNLLLEELRELLVRGFPDPEKESPTQEEKNDNSPAIHEVLNRIEDLVEAFEIGGRSR